MALASLDEYLFLVLAGFGAGIVNTIAGGGTFLTFPALVLVGIPPVAANATSAVVVCPGYLGGTLGFLREIKGMDRRLLLKTSLVAALGGLGGSLLLVASSNEAFSLIVPILLLFATGVFAFGGALQSWMRNLAVTVPAHEFRGTFIVSIYGGYFNGGLGIVLLALFALWGMTDLNLMNALKNGLSLVLSVVSFVIFAVAGIVAWPQAVIMMLAAIAGGYCGAPLARALPALAVRALIIAIGLSMSVVFFLRALA